MKQLIFLTFLLLFTTRAHAQTPAGETVHPTQSEKDLDSLDRLITRSPRRHYVTSRVFDYKLYNTQQFIGGTALRDGRLINTSAAVDTKSVALNLSTGVVSKNYPFAFQANIQGTSDDGGVVDLVKKGKYQNTLIFGGSVIWLFKSSFSFSVNDQRLLHQRLRVLRNRDLIELHRHSPTVSRQMWRSRYLPLLKEFYDFWQEHSTLTRAVWQTVLSPNDAHSQTVEFHDFLHSQDSIRLFLPKDWLEGSWTEANTWVGDHLADDGLRTTQIDNQHEMAEARQRQKLLVVYDSVQGAAAWPRRWFLWSNVGLAHNSTALPQFNSNNAQAIQTSEWNNQTTTLTLGLNGVLLRKSSRLYGSVGAQFLDRLNNATDSLVTHRRSRSVPGLTPPAVVVDSVQGYRAGARLPSRWTLNGELSLYLTEHKFGFDVATKVYFPSFNQYRVITTLGVFFPIVAADASTILLMPQVSYNSRDKFSFGASLAASIPGFFTKTEQP